VATSRELAPRHPEKVLMVKSAFAQEREEEHLAMIAALLEACEFCDQVENREQVMTAIAARKYLNQPVEALRMSMQGKFDFGNGRVEENLDELGLHIFHGGNANEPNREAAAWVMESLQVQDSKVLRGVRPERMFRMDIYRQALAYAGMAASLL